MMLLGFVVLFIFVIWNIFIFRTFFYLFFESVDEVKDCVNYYLQPNVSSYFRGELERDRAAEARLFFFVLLCLSVLLFEFFVLAGIFT